MKILQLQIVIGIMYWNKIEFHLLMNTIRNIKIGNNYIIAFI